MVYNRVVINFVNKMENPLQRERSLKKLHFCIANYHPTQQQRSALVTAQQDLRDKIQFKFRRSNLNTYVFPRKQQIKDQYSDGPEIVNLHEQIEPNLVQSEQKQKPKIKLAKGRTDKRLQTQNYDRNALEDSYPHPKIEERSSNYNSRPLAENNQNLLMAQMSQPLKERVKTQYSRKQESSLKKQSPLFLNSLPRESCNSRGKSKLSMLTKSYMNLKSAKLQENSADARASNTNNIRTNDYKFMPNSTTNHRTYASNAPPGFNSTRQLKHIIYGTNGGTTATEIIAKEAMDPKSLQKIESFLPNKKYFKYK